MIKLNVGNVFLGMEPQMALLDPAAAGSPQGDPGLFTQMLEALLAHAVGPASGGEPGLDLSGPDRALLVSGLLSLMSPAAGGMGESTVLGEGVGVANASSTSLLEALAALRAVMAQDVSGPHDDDPQIAFGIDSDAAEEAAMRDRLLSPDGLLALAAAGWLTPPGALPAGGVTANVADPQGQELAASGASGVGVIEQPTAEAATAPANGVTLPSPSGDRVSEASAADSIALSSLILRGSTPPSESPVRPPDLSREAQPRFQAPAEPLTPAVQLPVGSGIDQIVVTQTGDLSSLTAPVAPPLQQIVQGVVMLVRKGETQVRMQLHPESLGQVLVQLTFSKGMMSVHLLADSAAAHSVIQDHLTDLRTAFTNQGLQVDGLSVSVGSDPSAFSAMTQHQHDWSGGKGPAWITVQPTQDEPAIAPVRNRATGGARQYLVDYHV